MRSLIAFCFLLGAQAFAADYVSMVCKPVEPCLHADGLENRCVSKIQISGYTSVVAHAPAATMTLSFGPVDFTKDIIFTDDRSFISLYSVTGNYRFSDETGDQWGELYRVQDLKYVGEIAVYEDFAFKVTCEGTGVGSGLE